MRNWIVETWKKVAGTIKVAAVEHTKVMVITSCVVVAGATGTGVTIATVMHKNNSIQVSAETVQETTQEQTTMLSTVAETTTAEEETTTEEETTEAKIEEMIASGNVEILSMEQLDVKDSSEVEIAQNNKVDVVEDTSDNTVSSEMYEVNGLVRGIDVFSGQGDIDWSQVAESGIKFAIIQCGYRGYGTGNLAQDRCFEQNIQGALANGIQVGVYFFSQAVSVEEAYQEACLTLDIIQGYQITYPVSYDWETGYDSETGAPFRANSVGSNELRTKMCETFCDVIASRGYTPMAYYCENDWKNAVDASALTSKYKTWFAKYFYKYYDTGVDYQDGDNLPTFEWGYQIWQYTSTGSVSGISGNVDMNLALFSYENYEVQTQPVKIVVPADLITMVAGGVEPDIHQGVQAYNFLGKEATYETYIYNSNGDSIDVATAFANVGTYKISYSFNDPKNGKITKDVNLNVVNPIQLNISMKAFTTQAGTSINLNNGVSAKDANGKDATASVTYVITLNGAVVDEATVMKKTGQYIVTYSFADSMGIQSILRESATLTVTPKPTESESSQSSTDASSSINPSSSSSAENSLKVD